MGFWGSLVLCRPSGDLSEVEAIVSRDESVTEIAQPGGDWRIGKCEDTALIDDAEAFLRDLVAESGAPALLGYVLDSDCVDLVAMGAASGVWRSCLNREAMQAYAEDHALDESILHPGAAAERAAQWASEAGLRPSLPALLSVLSRTGDILFAESLFFELVVALGVASAAAAAGPKPSRPRRRTAKRPSNPLDAFVFDYATELLGSAGFTKKGRTFSHYSDRGDVAVVQFHSYPLGNLVDLQLGTGVSPEPVADFAAEFHGYRRAAPDDSDGAWCRTWEAPSRGDEPWAGSTWSVRDVPERDALGRELRTTLSQEVLPTLSALLDRATLLDVVQNHRLLPGHTTMGPSGIALVLLADEGPSVALDLAMRAASDHTFDQAALAWARRRLADRGYPDDSWRETVRRNATDPHVRLAAMLEAEVDEHMTAAGFTRTGNRYHLTSDLGDYALVEFTPLIATPDASVRFRIHSAVLPRPELEWRRARAAAQPDMAPSTIEPEARTGWLQTWHQPPPTRAVTSGPSPNLDATLWTFTPDTSTACGADIVEVLADDVLPRLQRLLDRTELLTIALDPDAKAYIGYTHATIILLVDNGPSEQLEAALQIEETGQGPVELELAAWARARLAETMSRVATTTQVAAPLVIDGVGRFGFDAVSDAEVFIRISDAVAHELTAGAGMASFARGTGFGQGSELTQVPADRVWIQASQDEAVLVVRREDGPEHAAFFSLGPLAPTAKKMALGLGRVRVFFVVGDEKLEAVLATARPTGRIDHPAMWGALVACTAQG
jgi:hypothetical protein